MALQEQVGEERREHSDLLGRTKELGERTAAQEREMKELKRTTNTLQAKVRTSMSRVTTFRVRRVIFTPTLYTRGHFPSKELVVQSFVRCPFFQL